MMPTVNNGLKCLNAELPENWEAKLVPDEGRIYYVDHKTESSSWLPPRENWDPGNSCMPYGWEEGVDKNNKSYFINHVENYTTRDDPRDDPDYIEPPKPRDIELVRDAQKGFGFVAGSEKPVVVRFVTEGGPSVDKLLPGDQLIKINGQDVRKAPREYVIDLVRSCKQISLTVCQPYNDNSARKSALLTAAKKDKLKKNPSRVRFAEEIIVNGASVPSASPEESYVPFMPNVLKVFLENGQTKSFKYDSKTTVKDVVNSLQEKLNLKCVQHFNLVLHNMKSHMPGRMTLLQDHETVAEIACRPGARHFRCLFRVVYVPRDSYDLLKQDPVAFEYFYMQCVNDVIQERFVSELKAETILRLAALHIQQHAMSNNVTGKINMKAIEKECGFEKFVPPSVRDNMRVKDLRKVLSQSMKLNQNLTAPGQKQLTALQAKLHYMKIVSELKTFGSRVFMVTLLDKKTEAMVLVGPKAGISLVTNIRFYTLSMLADFSEVQSIKVAKEKENMNRVELTIKGEEPGTLNLGLLKEDATNFVSMVNGYYRIFVDPNKTLLQKNAGKQSDDPDIPPYEGKHKVFTAPWSYPEDLVSMVIDDAGNQGIPDNERIVDLTRGPPAYEGNKEYISRLKEDLGIKSEAVDKSKREEKGLTPPPAKKPALSIASSTNEISDPVSHDTKTDFSVRKDTDVSQTSISVKTESPVKGDSKSVTTNLPTSSSVPGTPIKTVIMVDSHTLTKQDHVISDTSTNQPPVSNLLTNQKQEKHETDSIASSSSTGASQMSDSEEGMEDSPVIDKPVRKRTIRSPTPPPSHDKKRELEKQLRAEEIVEYENLKGVYYKKMDNENSDTDSGVGAEADKQIVVIHNSIPERCSSVDESDDGDGWETADDTGVELSANSAGSGTGLSQFTDLHLDLSSITNSQFGTVVVGDISPVSSTSLDPESSSFCPFNEDQLPQELADAMYDPRMFFNKEVYFDPDIIDLTLLPPYPPTKEEIEEMENHHGMSPLPPSPRTGTPKHSPLSKTASITEEHSIHPLLQKSMSVGYTPDFLDSDIDAIIDKLTVQPPPTDESVNNVNGLEHDVESENTGITRDSERLGQSWNGPVDQNGLDYENPELSHTVDLGVLALDDQYSSLVIPPPPEESKTIDEIAIVPPVESVKERRKKFESVESKTSEMSRILKANLKSAISNSSKSDESKNVSKKDDADESDLKTKKSVFQPESSISKMKPIKLKDSRVMNMFKDPSVSDTAGNETEQAKAVTDKTEADKTESPASVSEKLNELLKSLSVYDHEDEGTGHFRRTSSLRLGRCSSLDFLASDAKTTNKENSALQTGSVRLKPRIRPALNIERPMSVANGGPRFHIGSEPLTVSGVNSSADSGVLESQNSTNVTTSIPRANSYDALAPEKKLTSGERNDSFASLKAKLQLCRDTLLNRSLRKRSGSADRAERASLDGDAGERKSSLTRSNSFSQLFRRSGKTRDCSSSPTTDSQNASSPVSSARDLKILNTLTTPRSNFRPNTGPMQVQDRMAPKPPTPVSPRTSVSPREHPVEARKQKAGPLKALSSVFDKDKTADNKDMKSVQREKSSKKKAPEAPPLPKSSPPQLLANTESPPGTLISAKSITVSSSQKTSPGTSSGSPSPKTSPIVLAVDSSSKTPAKSSSPKTPAKTSSQKTSPSTSSSTTPTPPPRRRNLSAFTPKSGEGPVGTKSKDDSELKRHTSKSSVKTSPYATVGKMWRPMSMTSSASKDSEEYQTYNNFDALREMSANSKIPNGHIASSDSTSSVTSPQTKRVLSSSAVKSKALPKSDSGSVSERSFALLQEKVSASHTNCVKQILEKVYTSEDFTEATGDVEKLLSEFKQTMESLKSSRIDKKPAQFNMCKDELQRQVKQFVTDAKLLVSNATQTRQKLATNMNDSLHSLAKIFLHGQATMFMMEEIHQAQHLGSEVMRVTNAYKSTLNAAHAAVGKPLADPHMKYLMRQATNLATLLSNLLKSLKTLEQR